MQARSTREIEIKLAVGDPRALRKALRRLGFSVAVRRRLEQDTLFDTAELALRRRGCLLRLRRSGRRGWLTYKGKAAVSRRFKIRREWEFEVAERDKAEKNLRQLGFAPVFRYEKRRTIWRARGRYRGGDALLDETPIGWYLELEGPAAWIRRVARALGARPAEFITKSYAGLYADWRRQRGLPVRNMVFRGGAGGRIERGY